jgi:serine/threonine protein kinase/tetratricopeptide (TPR) repeat protein
LQETAVTELDLFVDALNRTDPAERAAFLDQACAGKPELRSRLEELLAGHNRGGNPLDRLPVAPTGRFIEPDSASVPATIDTEAAQAPHDATSDQTTRFEASGAGLATTAEGRAKLDTGVVISNRYTLVEKIAEGGMGEVWVARQTEPVKRQVALKLIKTGMDSIAVLQRFEQERLALAMMDHPNIAKVLDAGLTSTGQPFFVMELVNGMPLHKFCDEAKLRTKDRLELFVTICQAVQHAHQKGIVHRDLKPANILITTIDGRHVPKVIDFGVAKATAGKLTDESLWTQFGTVVGTLEYMSPEQASFTGEDIDTRADIYSLGVILYEMLTGLRPIDAKRLRKVGLAEMIRIIREEDPSKPSTRLSTDEALPSMAALRQIEPRRLMALLRGELDWVVMKCLEKHRERRYETAISLARDVQHYLADEPVEARPPSVGYRFSKFVRRHKGQVIAASLVSLALLGGLVAVVAVQRVANARLAASLSRETNANSALNAANAEITKSRAAVQARYELAVDAIKTFHTGVSEDFLLKEEKFRELRNKLLKSAADFYAKLGALLGNEPDPASRRALWQANYQVAELTAKVGAPEDALAAHRQVLVAREALAAETPGDSDIKTDVGRSLTAVAILLQIVGRTGEAEAMYRKAEALLLELAPKGGDSSTARVVLADCRSRLGRLVHTTGRLDEALSVYRLARADQEALTAVTGATAEVQRDLTVTINGVANLLAAMGKPSAAKSEYHRVLALRRKLADDNPGIPQYRFDLAGGHVNLGILLMHTSDPSKAEAEFRDALALYQKLADDIPAVTEFRSRLADSHHGLGWSMAEANKPVEAEAEYREALAIQQKLADDNPTVTEFRSRLADCHHNLGVLLFASGKSSEAEAQHRSAIAIQQKLADENSAIIEFRNRLALSHSRLGWLLTSTGKSSQALSEYRKGMALQQTLADEYPMIPGLPLELAFSLSEIGRHLARVGKTVEAIGYYRREEANLKKFAESGPLTPDNEDRLADCRTCIADLLRRVGKLDEALAACQNALALREQIVAAHPEVPFYRDNLGETYLRLGQVRRDMGNLTDAATALRRACGHYDSIKSLAGNSAFFRACCHAELTRLGNRPDSGVSSAEGADHAETAMAGLCQAVSLGYRDPDSYRTESALDPLRNRPDFQALIMDLRFPELPFAH